MNENPFTLSIYFHTDLLTIAGFIFDCSVCLQVSFNVNILNKLTQISVNRRNYDICQERLFLKRKKSE